MKQASDQKAIPAADEFILRWCHRLFRGYGIWVFANLLFYVVFLMMVCKGTFPGGFRGMMSIFTQALMISAGLLLGLSCCGAFALSGFWKRCFPGQPPVLRWLWYFSIPLPFLQVWGYLAIVREKLQDRMVWLALLILGTAGLAVTAGCGLAAPPQAKWSWIGWGAVSQGIVLLVQARLFWVMAGMQYTRKCFRLLMSIAGLTVFAILAPRFLMNQAGHRVDWVCGQLAQLGIPVEGDAARKAYFQGVSPDEDWCRLMELLKDSSFLLDLDRKTDVRSAEGSAEKPNLVAVAEMVKIHEYAENGDGPASVRMKQYAESSSLVQWLNHLPERRPLMRYRRFEDSGQYAIERNQSDLRGSRALARYFAARGRLAVRQGHMELAEQYWRRCVRLFDQLTAAPDSNSAAHFAVKVEWLGLELAADIITSGKLNAEELARWKQLLTERQAGYFTRLIQTMKGEPFEMVELARKGMPVIQQHHFHTWAGAPMFCYVQNDFFTGLNIQCYIFRDLLQPGWRPTQKNAYAGMGFQALNYLKGMTFTPMFMPGYINTMENAEMMFDFADLTCISIEIETFRLKNRRLPRNLAELGKTLPADSFAGRSYQYRIAEKQAGYTLHGVGRNRRDDGGSEKTDVLFTTVSPMRKESSAGL